MTLVSTAIVIAAVAVFTECSQPSAQEESETITAAQNGCPTYFAKVKPSLWHATRHASNRWTVTSCKAPGLSIEVFANEPPLVLCPKGRTRNSS